MQYGYDISTLKRGLLVLEGKIHPVIDKLKLALQRTLQRMQLKSRKNRANIKVPKQEWTTKYTNHENIKENIMAKLVFG